jgi:hypothetical protein
MTARSEHGAYIRGLGARAVNKAPVDVAVCRDALVNNANHLGDVGTEVRVSITHEVGAYYVQQDSGASDFQQPFGLYPIRIPLQILPSGDSVLLVPHLRAGTSAGTLTIRLFLSLIEGTSRTAISVPDVGDSCSEVTTSSAASDLTPDPIFISRDTYAEARGSRPRDGVAYLSLLGDLTPGTAYAPVAFLHMRWKVSTSADIKLYGLSAREFIG